MNGIFVDALPERLHCPYTSAPHPALIQAQAACRVPADFCGRVGVMLVRQGETIRVRYAFEPNRLGMVSSYRLLDEQALWPVMSLDDVPDLELFDGRGAAFGVRRFLLDLLNEFPDKPYFQGGKEIQWRKGQLCRAVYESLTAPAISLLMQHNREGNVGQIVALAEWWEGPSPAHEMRFAKTFYAPRATTKFLYDRLIVGHDHEPTRPMTTPDRLPDIDVLYEDDAMIIVNKPARLSSVPGIRETVSCFSILQQTRGMLHIVHRLDLDTSGVLCFAKSLAALRGLHDAFRSDKVQKRYEARLDGRIKADEGVIDLPLAINRLDRPRQCVLPIEAGAKPCVTRYRVLDRYVDAAGRHKTLVSLYPQTGRTHQLRVHCAHRDGLDAPIDGDPFYSRLGSIGERHDTRLCLHAAELSLPHPFTDELIHVLCPSAFPAF